MSKSRNQKLKIIYLYDILKRDTDSGHGITVLGRGVTVKDGETVAGGKMLEAEREDA